MVEKESFFQRFWWRLRSRRSRREAVSFALGMAVGRELCMLIGAEEARLVTNRIAEQVKEDYL